MSAVPRPVERERLPAASAVDQVGFQTVSVCGPAIGGIVIAAAGLPAAYLLDTVSFGPALAGTDGRLSAFVNNVYGSYS